MHGTVYTKVEISLLYVIPRNKICFLPTIEMWREACELQSLAVHHHPFLWCADCMYSTMVPTVQ